MKTFQEAVLKVRYGKMLGRYRELHEEAIQSTEVISLLTSAVTCAVGRLPEDKISDDELEKSFMEALWLVFFTGMMTGIEMETPD